MLTTEVISLHTGVFLVRTGLSVSLTFHNNTVTGKQSDIWKTKMDALRWLSGSKRAVFVISLRPASSLLFPVLEVFSPIQICHDF